ncbi:AAA family ATPase [Pseudanabaena sp. PCC 6802]|uniref:nucleotide-binding protein n=1 Tax=Pseudanabaena sp. PCC 6802 TaxID=118173 RepID=UPI00034B8718|nr:AAA family ATPase [Pseudanabaena sp. PCC 6802]
MILVFGGIKGGVGKTTLATNIAILRSQQGKDVLLVDADDQGTASDFTAVRNETFTDRGGAGYTSVKLHGAAVRSEVLRLTTKYDDIAIDVGGRDTAGQRAALSVADIYVVPFLPGSFDVWTLDTVGDLVEEARAFNDKLKAICIINRADAKGADNAEAAAIASETPNLTYIDAPLGNRKAFRSAAAQGLAVNEVKPTDPKAIAEIEKLFECLFDV